MGLQSWVGSKFTNLKILNFYLYLKILPQIKDSNPSFLSQHLELPVSVHMQKKSNPSALKSLLTWYLYSH